MTISLWFSVSVDRLQSPDGLHVGIVALHHEIDPDQMEICLILAHLLVTDTIGHFYILAHLAVTYTIGHFSILATIDHLVTKRCTPPLIKAESLLDINSSKEAKQSLCRQLSGLNHK
ncbi:hypothetical protein DPMN_179821 [Dreissena polymorpha]|uniref:Uncharacterized protein n=1 Tax=Dreissena polymorpha TaxID=45954 RepID=A0A9D4EEQ3_DREPO|nr:hypothetical protein DPMN_179821 [Dreissena polymorpha]